MSVILHLVTYACLVIFAAAVVVKYLKYNNMPQHLRWELYPVAHEGEKAHYGGSYFEDVDWWKKPRKMDRISEARHMVPEMLFLVALKEHNPSMWYRSFPFHFGMYSLIGFLVLLAAGGVMGMAGIAVEAGAGLGGAVYYLTIGAGFFGVVLGIAGALGLLQRRLFDEDLKDFTKPSDIFNLVFLLAVFALLLIYGLMEPSFDSMREYVRSAVAFDLSYSPDNPVCSAAILLASLVVAYIPLTHMSHFVVKWFTYHKIRWDDEPNMRGSAVEKNIGEELQYPITWAASHINPDGKARTWAQAATESEENK